ncbi:hypothetical protein U1Q18_008045 [Sarracenia purpurea var. burkii]
MIMHTVSFKEHEGIAHNPTGQLSQVSVPWWIGSQSVYGESVGQFKPSSLEHPTGEGQLTATKRAEYGAERGMEKGNTTQLTLFPGYCETLGNGPKPAQLQEVPTQSVLPPLEYKGHFELGYGQHVIRAKYPYEDQCYGVFSAYGPQIKGRIMLPLSLTMDDGPIYVNAKQYHGIIRRRLSRAKAESENKVLRVRKPYLHLSRHLHAMRRPRGCGGRFLNTKPSNSGNSGTETEKNTRNGQLFHLTESQNSKVLQSDSGHLNSTNEPNGSRSNVSGSEVTSMFSRGNFDRFSISCLGPSVHSLTDTRNTRHGIVMSTKWAATADGASNLKI